MKGGLLGLARFAVAEFGPLIVFYALLAAFGLKVAIAGSVLFILADVLRRRLRGVAFTRIYTLSAGLTVVFGAIDLLVRTPFMLNYESVITSLALAGFFFAGARGERPMIQEFAEQREGKPFPARADITVFFRILTYAWAGYFLLKAVAYFCLAQTGWPLSETMAIRSVTGPVSLGLMFLISFQGRRIFVLMRRLGWLPDAETTA